MMENPDIKELKALTEKFATPLYIYSEEKIRKQYAQLTEQFKTFRNLICYAVKANSNLSILKIFVEMGAGFDIVSGGELRRVIAAGGAPSKVVFSGVGKTREEIEYALAQQIKSFNVESASELKLIEKTAATMKLKASISFRINPDVNVDTHPYLATGLKTSKFGMPLSDAVSLYSLVKESEWLSLRGLSCHIGSQITDLVPFRTAYKEMLSAADHFLGLGAEITFVDLGGGIGVSYGGKYEPLDLDSYGEMVRELRANKPYELLFEPGKFLVAEAGILLTKVIYKKSNQANKFVIVDAGMNDLIRPSLYQAFHKVEVVPADGRTLSDKLVETDVVGPVCETGCYFARKRPLPEVREGDFILIRDAGAYAFSMASNYNSRPLPAEVLLKPDGTHQLIRRRQSYDEIWSSERIS